MLTSKQERFVSAYIELGDATKACIVAGYAAKSANVEASRMMKRAEIIEALNEYRKERRNAFTKEDFISLALNDYKSLDVTEPNKPRFLQLAGQGAGILGNTDRPSQSLTINQINIDSAGRPAAQLWEETRKLLGE